MERQLYTSWVGNISTGKSLAFQETWIPEWEKRIFVYKWTYLFMYLEDILVILPYWLLIFKSEKDKSYSLIGVQGMLVVPNSWDVGTWGWLERKIESLFYKWTHLYMDLEDIMVISPYKWTILSMHLESYHHQNGFWKKKEDIGIWKWRR